MTLTGKNIPQLTLIAGLALLLSGCYAYGQDNAYRDGYIPSYPAHSSVDEAYDGHHYYQHTHYYGYKPRYYESGHYKSGYYEPRRHQPEYQAAPAQAPQQEAPRSPTKYIAQPPMAAGTGGRGNESVTGPTARDTGPRPGAEGGAR